MTRGITAKQKIKEWKVLSTGGGVTWRGERTYSRNNQEVGIHTYSTTIKVYFIHFKSGDPNSLCCSCIPSTALENSIGLRKKERERS